MDTVLFGDVFAFTAVDIYTRESDVLLCYLLEVVDGKTFLDRCCMPRRLDNFAEVIQTDGGSEFKGAFSETISAYCHRHRVARPYKKNEQRYIESFNCSLRKECLGWFKYKVSELPQLTLWVEEWLRYYHYVRPHISLGMRPLLVDHVGHFKVYIAFSLFQNGHFHFHRRYLLEHGLRGAVFIGG
jgi:hypothetical protein